MVINYPEIVSKVDSLSEISKEVVFGTKKIEEDYQDKSTLKLIQRKDSENSNPTYFALRNFFDKAYLTGKKIVHFPQFFKDGIKKYGKITENELDDLQNISNNPVYIEGIAKLLTVQDNDKAALNYFKKEIKNSYVSNKTKQFYMNFLKKYSGELNEIKN